MTWKRISGCGLVLASLMGRPAYSQTPAVDADRIVRLEFWVETVLTHQPGIPDDRLAEIGAWPNADIRALAIDAGALMQVMRTPSRLGFSFAINDQKPQPVRYTTNQLRRLREMACALVGTFAQSECKSRRLAVDTAPFLDRIRNLAIGARQGSADNFMARRGALVHSDIVMLGLATASEPLDVRPGESQSFRVTISDGRNTDLATGGAHWQLARMLLDEVTPPASSRPAPAKDEMVRLWYQATAAWMQREEYHDTKHLDRARQLFPDDAELLFLSGSLHETYGAPPYQTAARSAVLPTGIRIDIGSERSELREAERFFRRCIDVDPGHVEAHLRLGRVMVLTDRFADAADHLRMALSLASSTANGDSFLEYWGSLFLGEAEQALKHDDAARESFERAAALYPDAQSPRLALSALARRWGRRDAALVAIDRMFGLTKTRGIDSDPWWTYFAAQGRHAASLLDRLRKPFLFESEP